MTVTTTTLFQVADSADGHHDKKENDDNDGDSDSDGTHSDNSEQ